VSLAQVFGFGQYAAGALGVGKASKDAEHRAHTPGVVAITRNIGDCSRRAVAVSAGDGFSVVLADDGAVLYMGTLGSSRVDWPTKVNDADGGNEERERFVAVSAGKQHVLLLSEAGRVFSFGAGDAGQLGHGDLEGRQRPERVAALEGKRIEQIAAGHLHRCASQPAWRVTAICARARVCVRA
jgi:alpha-tubulin suppressor-like RCC1 family protein